MRTKRQINIEDLLYVGRKLNDTELAILLDTVARIVRTKRKQKKQSVEKDPMIRLENQLDLVSNLLLIPVTGAMLRSNTRKRQGKTK